METFKVEMFKRVLREYYNEICEVMEDLDNEEISYNESEKALIQLDEKYAKRLAENDRENLPPMPQAPKKN